VASSLIDDESVSLCGLIGFDSNASDVKRRLLSSVSAWPLGLDTQSDVFSAFPSFGSGSQGVSPFSSHDLNPPRAQETLPHVSVVTQLFV